MIENQISENTNLILIYGRILVLDGIIQITEKDEVPIPNVSLPSYANLDNLRKSIIEEMVPLQKKF